MAELEVTVELGARGPRGLQGDWSAGQTIRTITGTADTPTSADAGRLLKCTNAAAVTITVDSSLNLAIGQRIDVVQWGTGQVSFVGSGATVAGTPTVKTRAQYSGVSIVCMGVDEYWLVGDLAAF